MLQNFIVSFLSQFRNHNFNIIMDSMEEHCSLMIKSKQHFITNILLYRHTRLLKTLFLFISYYFGWQINICQAGNTMQKVQHRKWRHQYVGGPYKKHICQIQRAYFSTNPHRSKLCPSSCWSFVYSYEAELMQNFIKYKWITQALRV